MYSTADFAVTPRPMYPADGRKLPDVYTQPAELRDELQAKLGTFPLFHFWGPTADIVSSRWIGQSARHIVATRRPDLDPRLPPAPRLRPAAARSAGSADSARPPGSRRGVRRAYRSGGEGRRPGGRAVRVRHHASEGRGAPEPRAARGGLLEGANREGPGAPRRGRLRSLRGRRPPDRARLRGPRGAYPRGEGAARRPSRGSSACSTRKESEAWASTTRAPASSSRSARPTAGSATTTGSTTRARPTSRAPSTSTASRATTRWSCSSIPPLPLPKLKIGWKLARKALGFRTLLDVIPLDASLVRGSHGRLPDRDEDGPVFLSSEPDLLPPGPVEATAVKELILDHVFGDAGSSLATLSPLP